ncbi:MAG: RNA polymerase sigma factor [Kofleriaceae bacterium]
MSRDRLRELLEPIYPQVVAFARHLSRSRTDGDDLYQEAVLRALTKLGQLRDDAAFRPWLYRIVISIHRNRERRGFWRRLLPIEATPEPDKGYRDWSAQTAEAARRAREALASLPVDQREAIVLFELEGWTVEEIAALYRVSISAVKSRLARGRDRMRQAYDERESLALAEDSP